MDATNAASKTLEEKGHEITVRRLSSGYFHIRGAGVCNWSQPPRWPCDEETFRAHTFTEASEEFIEAALALLPESGLGPLGHPGCPPS